MCLVVVCSRRACLVSEKDTGLISCLPYAHNRAAISKRPDSRQPLPSRASPGSNLVCNHAKRQNKQPPPGMSRVCSPVEFFLFAQFSNTTKNVHDAVDARTAQTVVVDSAMFSCTNKFIDGRQGCRYNSHGKRSPPDHGRGSPHPAPSREPQHLHVAAYTKYRTKISCSPMSMQRQQLL